MRATFTIALGFFIFIISAACHEDKARGNRVNFGPKDLREAKGKWNQWRPAHYEFSFYFNSSGVNSGEYRVEVDSGKVIRLEYRQLKEKAFAKLERRESPLVLYNVLFIEGLFDLCEAILKESDLPENKDNQFFVFEGTKIQVDFDDRIGYPKRIESFCPGIADGTNFTIEVCYLKMS